MAFIVTMLTSNSLLASEFDVAGTTIQLPQLGGFCELDRTMPVEKALYETMSELQKAAGNSVLVLSIPCDELDRFQRGNGMSEWSQWITPNLSTTVRDSLRQLSRATIVESLERTVPQLDITALSEKARAMAQDKAQLQLNVQEIGLIGKDSNALYVGIAMTAALNNDTSVSVVSGVISITFVNSTIVNLGVYRELRDASSGQNLSGRPPLVLR